VREAAEHAFRLLFLMSAGVSLIAPFFVMRLKEKTLRGSPAGQRRRPLPSDAARVARVRHSATCA
jgi:hypothetical protein